MFEVSRLLGHNNSNFDGINFAALIHVYKYTVCASTYGCVCMHKMHSGRRLLCVIMHMHIRKPKSLLTYMFTDTN